MISSREDETLLAQSLLQLGVAPLKQTEMTKTDIQNKNDVERFVNGFYERVRTDEILSPVFDAKIPDSAWPAHLQRLYAFWNAILFAETGFQGNPMQKHLNLPVDEKHFDRWLLLFNQTIDENFSGPKAEEAKTRAASIAGIMNFKIESFRKA